MPETSELPFHTYEARDFSKFTRSRISGMGAFGDVVTAALTPVVQHDFIYGGHQDLVYEYTLLGGSITYSDSLMHCSTGTTAFGTAYGRSYNALKYHAGQGALFRFTAIYDTPTAGVSQTAGAYGGSENGLFFGYDYADTQARFGVCRQHSGVRDIHTFTVDTAASGAETLSLTLNGVTTNVSLTAGDQTHNASEIAATSFSGWDVEQDGNHVHFLANNVGAREGSYADSSTGTADGTWAQEVAGAAVTEDWVYQDSWNVDRCDGTGPSKMVLDPTKGNVYQISLQYLGFGGIDFYIENPNTRTFQLVHRYTYANENTTPSITNPTFYLGAAVSNVSGTADKTVSMGSYAGFMEGANVVTGPLHGSVADGSVTNGTTVPVVSIRCNRMFVSDGAGVARANFASMFIKLGAISCSGSNKPVKASLVVNGTLTGASWDYYAHDHSIASVDTSATAISGGDTVAAIALDGAGGTVVQDLTNLDAKLNPGDIVSIVVEPTGTTVDYVASLSWREDV